jgi:hypothetical protein
MNRIRDREIVGPIISNESSSNGFSHRLWLDWVSWEGTVGVYLASVLRIVDLELGTFSLILRGFVLWTGLAFQRLEELFLCLLR